MSPERQVALVSGANRGIGAEIARQLATDHGFLVLAGARDPSKVAELEGLVPLELDVSDQASVDAARGRVEADPGRLDVLVNNAGVYGTHRSIADFDLDDAHRTVETNAFGALRLSQAMVPLLRRSGDARVVNVSSGAGQLSDMNGGSIGYRMSKAALNAITRVLSEEEDFRVNSICPGWVRTDMGGRGATRSVAEGADTAVWLATDPDAGSGGFYRDRRPIPW
jgi:NAD(P)-dependent dehydrogenase (short-subunit alcohol dehydrogenase family)